MLSEDSRALQEEERLLFLPDKDSANEKAQTLWTVSSQLPVPSIKQFSSSPALALQGLAGWAHPGDQPQVAILC